MSIASLCNMLLLLLLLWYMHAQARLTMRMMNQWSEANVDQYLQWAQQLQAEMDSDSSWQLQV